MLPLLQIIFIALKLFGLVQWDWWIVFSPILLQIVVRILGELLLGLVILLGQRDGTFVK